MNLLLANVWLPSAEDLRLFSPELVLVGTIVAVLVIPLVAGRRPALVGLLAMAGALVGLLATAGMAWEVTDGGRGGLTPPGTAPLLLADRFTVFFKMLLFTFLVVVIWLWMIGSTQREAGKMAAPTSGEIGWPEFFVLLLTSALGMLLMVSTLNLLVLVIAIETASLPSYAIVASDRRSRLGAEASLKYVMFGASASAIMVYGASLLYGRFGTLDVGLMARQLAGSTSPDMLLWLALAALGVGILFKIAAVPMHLWCPDVFEGAPIEITTWLSVASKAAGLGLLLRLVDTFAGAMDSAALREAMSPLACSIGAIAAITCTVGNLAALRQESVKRILAYSSIAHAGYMLMAGAVFASGSRGAANPGISALVSYLCVYVVMNLGAFGTTALVVWQTGSDHLSAFTGLGRRAPWLALPLAVCLFSLVGLPPLGGFAAKWFLLVALGKSATAQPWLWSLVVIAVVNTAISLYYYVRIIRQMYLTDDPAWPAFRPPAAGVALVNLCAVLLLLLGTLWLSPLGRRADVLASNLF